MHKFYAFAALATGLVLSQACLGAPLFSDNLNTAASSANYAAVTSDATSSFATYAYDYSVMGIPSAPHSGDGSTRGLRLDANFSAPNAAEAITLHSVANYNGDFVVKFDAWLNVNGPFPDGGSGSTNYLTAGVGGDGTTNNHVNNTGINGWTAVNGENGSGIDYRLYKGSTLQAPAGGEYAAGTAAGARNGLDPYYSQFGNVNVSNMPVQGANNGGPAQQNGTSFAGSFGMAWHQVQLIVDDNGGTGGAPAMQWSIDGLRIGTENGGFISNGKLTFGYSDPTANGSDNPPLSFALFDNITVDSIPEPATALMLPLLAGLSLARRRH